MSEKKIKYLYRYEMEHWEGIPKLFLIKLPIVGKTPCGIYVELKHNRRRWIGNTTRNRYAHNSEEQALKGYIRRKTYRNHCIELEAERNEATLIDAKELLRKYDKPGKEQITKGSPQLSGIGRLRKASFSSSDW